MKTLTVESILKAAAARVGMDGSVIGNIPMATRVIMLDNLRSHLRDAWEFFDWPDLCRTEERTVQDGSDGEMYLDKEQAGETAMGEVFGVWRDNPHTHERPREIGFTLDVDRVVLAPGSPGTVWVRFRLEPTEISTDMTTALAQTVPQVLSDAVKFNLAGDLLTEDGQLDKAEVHYGRAERSLISEMDKVVLQQHQPRRWSARV